MSDLPTKTRKIVAEQLGQLMLSNIELTAQLQEVMPELGRLKSEAASKAGARGKKKPVVEKPLATVRLNGSARA